MKRVAFVGSSEKWWMPYQREEAVEIIIKRLTWEGVLSGTASHHKLNDKHDIEKETDWKNNVIIVSGGCPYGGVDIWAEVIADSLGIEKNIYNPRGEGWTFYKERNILIAENCDVLYCIEPEWSTGMEYNKRYMSGGFTCRRSGGIWTMEHAIKNGVETHLEVIPL